MFCIKTGRHEPRSITDHHQEHLLAVLVDRSDLVKINDATLRSRTIPPIGTPICGQLFNGAPFSRPRRTQRCSDAPSVTVIRSILPITCYPTLRYISRQQQPPYLAHFSLMQSTCLRTKPTPKHLTPTKMQDFAANESENRYSRGCSPVGSVPNDWHPGQVKLFVKSWASGLPWAGNPELLHTELKCGPLYPQSCCRSIRTGKHPVGLLQHRQDVPLFHLFEGRSSIHVPVCVRSLCFRPRERMTARSITFCSSRTFPGDG